MRSKRVNAFSYLYAYGLANFAKQKIFFGWKI